MLFLERVGDVFQEDEAEDDVFIFGSVEVAAKFVGGGPKRGFKAEVSLGTASIADRL